MKLPIFTVDAFTSKTFKGNPAAVCILKEAINDSLMQDIAFEMNLSETAFLLEKDDGYGLRWFTPTAEVDLCGHATLSSAHILWQEGLCKKNEPIRFHTKSGLLITNLTGDEIEMDFPAIPEKEVSFTSDLVQALGGAKPKYVCMTKWNYLVELETEEEVKNLKPDYDIMVRLPGWGVIVTAKSLSGEFDFISRFFAPEKGVPEDPVTGSAHCALGPFWQKQLGKKVFNAYQASPRGGRVGVRVEGDRVFLSGNAVTVIKGEINY